MRFRPNNAIIRVALLLAALLVGRAAWAAEPPRVEARTGRLLSAYSVHYRDASALLNQARDARLIRLHADARHQDQLGPGRSDKPSKSLGIGRLRQKAKLHHRVEEARPRDRQSQIAGQRHAEGAARQRAVQRGDGQAGQPRDRGGKPFPHRVGRQPGARLVKIGAGGKDLAAPGQHEDAGSVRRCRLGRLPRLLQGVGETLHHVPLGVDLECFHPRHRDRTVWTEAGIDPGRVARYPGLKEELYLADSPLAPAPIADDLQLRPDALKVLLRPPATDAHYHNPEAEAIALANDSEYGLSASVWSSDMARAERVARALDVGNVSINIWDN